MRRQAIVNNDFPLHALFPALAAGLRATQHTDECFSRVLADFLGTRQCRLSACGFAALTVILSALREQNTGRDEIIIPAYTAPGLVLPARKLGLKVVLCDVERDGFLMDRARLEPLLGKRTLAVIPVHMFGLPCDIDGMLRSAGSGITVIEDCAQALGTEMNGKKAGTRAPYAFGSFSRGKNFSFYNGGYLALNAGADDSAIFEKAAHLPPETRTAAALVIMKYAAFTTATQPAVYAALSRLLSSLKSKKELSFFEYRDMAPTLVSIALPLFNLWRKYCDRRIENGRYLHAALKDNPACIIPEYPENARIAFNRFPLIVPDTAVLDKLITALGKRGIEASRMYGKPVHHAVDAGYAPGDLPRSVFLAGHLLTLPVHGNMAKEDLDRIISVMEGIA